MVCLNPKPVNYHWCTIHNKKTGKKYKTKEISFTPWNKVKDNIYQEWIPCGKCEGCKVDKASDTATKAYLEAKKWPVNAFLTLTYDNAHLPKKRTLVKRDLQLFWKKLRKHIFPQKIKYIACGEYGPKTLRPHYHAAIFNYWPEDCKKYKTNEIGDLLYTSKSLNKIWGNGYVIIGNLTYESAAYIARYVYKKAYGADKIPIKAGKTPEYTTCSKRPGIALETYLNKENWEKILRNNGVIIATKTGLKIKPIPQYLKNKWKEDNPKEYYTKQTELKEKIREKLKKILEKTTKNINYYKKQTDEQKRNSLKRLDKHRNKIIELE